MWSISRFIPCFPHCWSHHFFLRFNCLTLHFKCCFLSCFFSISPLRSEFCSVLYSRIIRRILKLETRLFPADFRFTASVDPVCIKRGCLGGDLKTDIVPVYLRQTIHCHLLNQRFFVAFFAQMGKNDFFWFFRYDFRKKLHAVPVAQMSDSAHDPAFVLQRSRGLLQHG